MDPIVNEDYSDFREEVRTWLAEHLVGSFTITAVSEAPPTTPRGRCVSSGTRTLRRQLAGINLAGGIRRRGAGLAEEIVFEYEYARAAAPARVNTQALELLGPTLLAHGSEEHKRRFLPRILAVEEMWGQGFSEPDAGSDLAAVRTKAVFDGGEWHIDGQKVWTTFGDRADWLYVLCRTDPDPALRHRGLTLLLVPVDQPGVEIRPIANIARSAEFSDASSTMRGSQRTWLSVGVGKAGPS